MTKTGRWVVGFLLVMLGVVVVLYNWSNWNFLKGPISRSAETRTGRQLQIGGDLIMHLRWPDTRIQTSRLRFANPDWAEADDMVDVKNVALKLHVPSLLKGSIVLTEVKLDQAQVSLEKNGDGRKNWLLDRDQKNENASVKIRALAINNGQINYLEPAQKTRIQADLSTTQNAGSPAGLIVEARGSYRGQTLKARGRGGNLLSLRDRALAYPINISGTIGPTTASAAGRVTNLVSLSTLDLNIALRGGSLAQLYPLTGVVLPDTPSYRTQGRLIREGALWRYEKFSGVIGRSDISGTLALDAKKHPRPLLKGSIYSRSLNFADLGPLVGRQSVPAPATPRERILPTSPFRTERWKKMDADVAIKANTIIRNAALPINNLATRLSLQNAKVTLDPLKFGVAGGTLAGLITLDGNASPIRASADLEARQIQLAKLFPKLESAKTSIGLVNGDIELTGRGDNVAAMLGSSDGRFALVLNEGAISKFMMEAVGLHVLEMLSIKLTKDRNIKINCGIVHLGVKDGLMQSRTMMLDTDITRLNASGNINLRNETLDLTLTQKSKKFSLIALRPPIHIHGNFSNPKANINKATLATRSVGAAILGAVNPLLALIPLVEMGKEQNSECARLIKAGL